MSGFTMFVKTQGFLVTLILILSVSHHSCQPNGKPVNCSPDSLILVQCIFRHGNRTRDNHEGFPKDKYKNESAWMPLGFGQLTPAGRNTEYQLGRFLRSRYDTFLPRVYFYKDISVSSSHIYRTMESAQLVSAGLYSPPVEGNRWGQQGNELGNQWQPIPVATMPEEDRWLEGHAQCPPYDKEYEEVLTKQLAKDNEKNRDLYALLSTNTGQNVTTIREAAKICNTLKVDEENGKALPDWATPDIRAQLEPFHLLGFTVRSYSPLMKKVKAGPLLNLLSVNMNNKTRGELSPDNKMILYSGHDSTLISLLDSMGANKIWDTQYGACLLIELHKIQGEYSVQVLYLKSGLDRDLETVTFQDWKSEDPIPLKVFNNILDKYQTNPTEWYKTCEREMCELNNPHLI